MQLAHAVIAAIVATLVSAQTLNIPTRVGSKVVLLFYNGYSGSKVMGNKEYDRGHTCNSDKDTGSASAVFVLENGATLSNVVIGANALEGVHFRKRYLYNKQVTRVVDKQPRQRNQICTC